MVRRTQSSSGSTGADFSLRPQVSYSTIIPYPDSIPTLILISSLPTVSQGIRCYKLETALTATETHHLGVIAHPQLDSRSGDPGDPQGTGT
jgi:hypothetical protein